MKKELNEAGGGAGQILPAPVKRPATSSLRPHTTVAQGLIHRSDAVGPCKETFQCL
jgi:hypothetical protein